MTGKFRAGDRLGPYEVLQFLGRSGLSTELYRARDTQLDRVVAISIMLDWPRNHQDRLERTEQNARRACQLQHPHLCAVYDVGRTAAHAYVALEWLDSPSVQTRLREAGPFSASETVTLARQLASAVEAVHQFGVPHGNVTPANIFLTETGAKLRVSGLVEFVPDAANRLFVSGTPAYMAPEQLLWGSTDLRSDVFAFGAVLHEMLSGQPAFGGKDTSDVIAAVLRSEPVSLRTRTDVPTPLVHLIETCLAREPEQRWQAMRDIQRQLASMASVL